MNNKIDFNDIIGADSLTLVDFYASWCGPCKAMHPVMNRLREEMSGRVHVVQIDIDDAAYSDITRKYNVRSVPTFILFRKGATVWRSSGVMPYDYLRDTIMKYERAEASV